jgi:hypothetical protein
VAASIKVRGVTVDQLLVSLIAGVIAHFPSASSLVIDGVTYDKEALLQKLQEVNGPFKKAEDLRVQSSNAIKERDASEGAAATFAEKAALGLQYLFGSDANVMAAYGLTPPKARRQLTPQEKVARAAKAAETRKLRNTMGSRQKQAVKATGEVEVTAKVGSAATNATGGNGSTATPTASTATPANGAVGTSNGATGPQEVNGAAH